MNKKYIQQIEDLIHDRETFITTDEELNKVFKDDIEALKYIISRNEELEIANESLASTCSYFHKKIVNQKSEIKDLNKRIEEYKLRRSYLRDDLKKSMANIELLANLCDEKDEIIKKLSKPLLTETTKYFDGTIEIKVINK